MSLFEHLEGFHRTEAEYPELQALPTFSAAWYRLWRELHLARYPNLDVSSRTNLDMFVERAERREAQQIAGGGEQVAQAPAELATVAGPAGSDGDAPPLAPPPGDS